MGARDREFEMDIYTLLYLKWITNNNNNKMDNQGSPGGPVVKNLPCNAGDTGLIPGPGRSHIPWGNQAPAPLNLLSGTQELQLLSPWEATTRTCVLHNKRSHCNEKPIVVCVPQLESSPCSPKLEKAQAQQ